MSDSARGSLRRIRKVFFIEGSLGPEMPGKVECNCSGVFFCFLPWCLKITKKTHITLRAKLATFTFRVAKSLSKKNAKNGHIWRVFENLKFLVKQSYQTGQDKKLVENLKNSNATFLEILKHCVSPVFHAIAFFLTKKTFPLVIVLASNRKEKGQQRNKSFILLVVFIFFLWQIQSS